MTEKRRKRRQWGKGSIIRAANGSWKVRWCEGGKRRKRGGFATRDDAERVLARILGDLAQGKTGLPADPRTTPKLGELATDFLERRKRTHRAGAEDGSRWRKHVAPFFDYLRPTQVDAARIRAFIEAKLATGANPATIRIYVALISALFVDLCERGIAQTNPARGASLGDAPHAVDARPAHHSLHREVDRGAAHLPGAARAAERRLCHRRSRRPAHGRSVRAALAAR